MCPAWSWDASRCSAKLSRRSPSEWRKASSATRCPDVTAAALKLHTPVFYDLFIFITSMLSPSVFVVTKSASPGRTLTVAVIFPLAGSDSFFKFFFIIFFFYKGSVRIESWEHKGQLSRCLPKAAFFFYSVVHTAAAVYLRQRHRALIQGRSPSVSSLDFMTEAHWVVNGTWILGNQAWCPLITPSLCAFSKASAKMF